MINNSDYYIYIYVTLLRLVSHFYFFIWCYNIIRISAKCTDCKWKATGEDVIASRIN